MIVLAQQLPPGAAPVQPQRGGGVLGGILIGCMVVLVVVVAACGVAGYFVWRTVAPTVNNVAQVARGIQSSAGAAGSVQPGASPDVAQGLAALKGLIGGGKGHVETLSREQLSSYLPLTAASLARRGSISSSKRVVMGIQGTNVEGTYGDGERTCTITITDAANVSGLTGLYSLLIGAVSEETDEGYQKAVDLGDLNVHEQWTNAGKHAEIDGIEAGRFLVQVESNGLDMTDAERAFKDVDEVKLSAVAAAAPQH